MNVFGLESKASVAVGTAHAFAGRTVTGLLH
jgi:hypothetical protein